MVSVKKIKQKNEKINAFKAKLKQRKNLTEFLNGAHNFSTWKYIRENFGDELEASMKEDSKKERKEYKNKQIDSELPYLLLPTRVRRNRYNTLKRKMLYTGFVSLEEIFKPKYNFNFEDGLTENIKDEKKSNLNLGYPYALIETLGNKAKDCLVYETKDKKIKYHTQHLIVDEDNNFDFIDHSWLDLYVLSEKYKKQHIFYNITISTALSEFIMDAQDKLYIMEKRHDKEDGIEDASLNEFFNFNFRTTEEERKAMDDKDLEDFSKTNFIVNHTSYSLDLSYRYGIGLQIILNNGKMTATLDEIEKAIEYLIENEDKILPEIIVKQSLNQSQKHKLKIKKSFEYNKQHIHYVDLKDNVKNFNYKNAVFSDLLKSNLYKKINKLERKETEELILKSNVLTEDEFNFYYKKDFGFGGILSKSNEEKKHNDNYHLTILNKIRDFEKNNKEAIGLNNKYKNFKDNLFNLTNAKISTIVDNFIMTTNNTTQILEKIVNTKIDDKDLTIIY